MNTHNKIGISTLILAIAAGVSGGIAALLMQVSAFIPVLGSINHIDFIQNLPQTHARMMVFFVLQPALMLGFGAWFVPILISSKDMAVKAVNVFSFCSLIIGFVSNFLTFLYPEDALLSLLSLGFWSISAILFSVNMIVTIVNCRGAGFGFLSLPLFVWGQGIASVLLLPIASVLLAALTKDYWNYSTQLGWAIQQTVHSFVYPMLMVLIVPAICLVFHIISTIANQTIRHYGAVLLVIVLVPFTILLSWNKMIFHNHLISLNQNLTLQIFYAVALYILVFSLFLYCLKLFVTGDKKYPAPILWCFGFIGLLAIGWPYQGIMKEVGLIHSCISYGILFSLFAGFYFWMGKILGKPYSEFLAKLHFALTCIGVFFTLDMLSIGNHSLLIGAAFMGASLFVFLIVLMNALRSQVKLPENYWGEGAITHEWQLPSPVFSRVK